MKHNDVAIASMILAIFMVSAVLLIKDPVPSSYPSTLISEEVISKGADFCRACP